jgi:hypothetical protein
MSGYGGNDIVRGYASWFGIDLLCAITELRMLGVDVDVAREQGLRRAYRGSCEMACGQVRREGTAGRGPLAR